MKKYVAWLTINNNCNLACQWCYQGKLKGRDIRIMEFRLAKKLLDLLEEIECRKVIILGGEPSVHPRFFDILNYSKIKKTVVTNGIKFADKQFTEMAKKSGLDGMSISLKAPSEELYAEWTGGCGLNDALMAAENAMDLEIDTQMSITVTEQVMDNWQQLLSIIRKSAKYFTFSFERPVISNECTSLPDSMHPKNVVLFIERIMYPTLREAGANFSINITFPQCHFSEGFVDKINASGNAISGCQMISNEGIIFDPSGNVIPCNHLHGHPVGRYGEEFNSGEEFLKWRESRPVGKFFQTLSNPPDKQCSACSTWVTCGGGCRMFWLHFEASTLLPNRF